MSLNKVADRVNLLLSQGSSEQVMNRHFAIKISCFIVVKLRNSPAITRVPRLESECRRSQSARPGLNQSFPGLKRQSKIIQAINKTSVL